MRDCVLTYIDNCNWRPDCFVVVLADVLESCSESREDGVEVRVACDCLTFLHELLEC